MHFALLFPVFLVLVCLPETSTFMDCRPACQKCRKGSPTPDVLEFYCTMCKECRDRNHDAKIQNTGEEHKERSEGAELSSTGRPSAIATRLESPGGQLAVAGGRPRMPMGLRGRLLGPRGRLLKPRLDFLNKIPFGKGGRLGKMGNGALRFVRGQNGTHDVDAFRAQLQSKYVSHPINIAQLRSAEQLVTLIHSKTTTPTTLTMTTIKSIEKLIAKMKQLEKDLHKEKNKNQILHELQNELQANERQLTKPNEIHHLQPNELMTIQNHLNTQKNIYPLLGTDQNELQPNEVQSVQLNEHRLRQDYIVKSLSGHSEDVPSFLPLEKLRPLVIGDQIVYVHEATTVRPADCPPPPPGCEEVTEKVLLLAVTTTSTTTTTTTTTTKPLTPAPCPPIKCQKKESCCPDCPCPVPLPLPLPLPPPPPPPPPMLRPPPPPMLPRPPPLMLRPPPLMFPPPPPMIPRPPLSILPPPPPPMLPRPPQPMLPPAPPPPIFQPPRPPQPMLPPPPPPPMFQPPPPPQPMLPPPPPPPMFQPPPLPPLPPPSIMAIPLMPQLMMHPPMSMLKPQCTGGGCNYAHGIRPIGQDGESRLIRPNEQIWERGQNGQKGHGFSKIPGVYDTPFDNYEDYTGKVRETEYLRKKSTVRYLNKDYYYVYVGVPKNNVHHLKNNLLREGVQSNTIPTN